MSDSVILREFLVALGFKTGDAKKFVATVDRVTKTVGELATGLDAMAVAATAAVAKVSSQFEDLYYASQRIGASVTNIQAYGFAIGQVGGTAQGARQALENLAEFIRSNPAGEGLIRGLGVETRDANGQLKDMTAIMDGLAKSFRAMPYWAAKLRAQMLGIDTSTLQAMLRGTDEFSDHYRAMVKRLGIDQQAAAASSHQFMNDLRDLMTLVTLAADRVIIAVQPWADKLIGWLEALDAATNGWSTAIIALVAVLGPLLLIVDPIVVAVGALAAGIVALIIDFNNWKAGSASLIDWRPWSKQIDQAIGGFKEIGSALKDLETALAPVGKLFADAFGPMVGPAMHALLAAAIDQIHSLAAGIRTIADAINIAHDVFKGDWGAAARDTLQYGKDSVGFWAGQGKALAEPYLSHGTDSDGKPRASPAANEQAPATGRGPAAGGVAAGAAALHGAISDHVLAFFQGNGLTRAQATGIAAGISAEGGAPDAFNASGGGQGAFGIGQWRGDRLAALRARFGPNPTLDQQLQFMLWELRGGDRGGAAVLGAGSARATMENYLARFMRPGAGLGGDLSRGDRALMALNAPLTSGAGPNLSMSQSTNINVHGGDAHATGKEVAFLQGQVNADLVRNLKTAVA